MWLCVAVVPAFAQELDIPVTRDNSIIIVKNEHHLNHGRKSRIRIKGNQHIVAMGFDTSRLEGRRIESATLVCHKGAASIDGLTVSTIQAEWDECKSTCLTSGMQPEPGWGRPGDWFPNVCGGNSFSLLCQAPSAVKNGVYYWKIDPDLVHACGIGAAYGLALHEFRVDYSLNPTIFSREQGAKQPRLVVRLGGTEPAPQPPSALRAYHTGDRDGLRLELTAPRSGFAYEVRVGEQLLPRWNTPYVDPGQRQVIPIRDVDLAPGNAVKISVSVLNRVGKKSAPVSIMARVPRPRTLRAPGLPAPRSVGQPPAGLAVVPLLDRYTEGGQPVGRLPGDYLRRNEVFDGTTIRLAAARGEVVGFQVLARGKGTAAASCEMPGLRTDIFRALYVDTPAGRVPDPLVPLERLELSPDIATPICVDVYVPFDFAGKEVVGRFRLSDGRELPVRLTVRPFALPRKASFLCEMNSYGLPNRVSEFYRLQRIAYDHRVHCNILHYSHRTAAPGARKCNMDMLMDSGRRMNERRYNAIRPGDKKGYWDDFTEVFGPYLSGSVFAGGHRGAIPAPGFYLTFHESWPLNVRSHFNGDLDAYQAFKGQPAYAQTYVDVLRDFSSLVRREGWGETGFQVYLNNKGKLADKQKNPWILDEPTSYWDYRALAFYGDLTREGARSPPTIRYRIDISRPQFTRGQLEGKADLWVCGSGGFRRYERLIMDRAERTGEDVWIYGTTSAPEASSRETQAWVLEAYRRGASGVVPWQTINRNGSALRKGDRLGLFIFVPAAGRDDRAIHHSMRLKAYRRAQQDIEYLELLRKKLKLTREELGMFVDAYAPVRGEQKTRYAGDAGTSTYTGLSPEAFRRLREAAAGLLSR